MAAACLGIQFGFRALLRMVERDTSRILAGQWWRLFSALFFQDGWLVGGVTNIAALLLVGSLALQVLGRVAWLAAYGVGAEGVAWLWQPVGAGNSIAVCALAGAMIATPPLAGATRLSRVFRIAAAGAAVLLLAKRDIHGAGLFRGCPGSMGRWRASARGGESSINRLS